MRKGITVLMLLIAGSAMGQVGMEDYTGRASGIYDAKSGVRTELDEGYTFRYFNSFSGDEVEDVYAECVRVLDHYGLDIEDPINREESFNLPMVLPDFVTITNMLLVDNEYIRRSWVVNIDDDNYYVIFLIMSSAGVEFTMELRRE